MLRKRKKKKKKKKKKEVEKVGKKEEEKKDDKKISRFFTVFESTLSCTRVASKHKTLNWSERDTAELNSSAIAPNVSFPSERMLKTQRICVPLKELIKITIFFVNF